MSTPTPSPCPSPYPRYIGAEAVKPPVRRQPERDGEGDWNRAGERDQDG